MDKLQRIKDLTEQLNTASFSYYNTGHPIMDNSEFDLLLDELQQLENELGVLMEDSPTINAGSRVAKEQKKIKHEHPMLSLDKAHSVEEIKKFLNGKEAIVSIKLDGLTVSATYLNGKLTRLESRGNGDTGTDVMVHRNSIYGLPKKINHKGKYVIDGECIVTYDDFYAINDKLPKDEQFSNPRNMASGSLNLLDSNISAKRGLTFVAWNVIEDTECYRNNMGDNLENAKELGFTVVPFIRLYHYDDRTLDDVLEQIKRTAEEYSYPMDGAVFSFNDVKYGKSLGRTEKFFRHSVAFKYEDESVETALTRIDWTMGKTGVLTPTAVFKSVELAGTIVERASVHNVSILTQLQLTPGDTVEVFKSNMIIPQIRKNLSATPNRDVYIEIPTRCPVCGGYTKIRQENASKVLVCTNPDCKGKLLGKLSHFVSKNAINIEGLSEQTLQKFIDLGYVKSFKDIMHLKDYSDKIKELDGFGERSVNKLLDYIEKSRNTTLDQFIYSLSIPNIGRSASKEIAKYFNNDFKEWYQAGVTQPFKYTLLDDFGEIMEKNIHIFAANNSDMIYELSKEFTFEKVEESNNNVALSNKIFVITGSLTHYKNRNELVSVIEQLGGKVSGSVSAKTSYLINNDTQSNSSKNQKAKKLNVPIISEEDFIKMIGE